MEGSSVLDHLVKASTLLSAEADLKSLVSVLVEQSADHSRSDLCCLYTYNDPDASTGAMRLLYRRGIRDVPDTIPAGSELMEFIEECGEAVLLLERRGSPFDEMFLSDGMNSGIVLPVKAGKRCVGALFLNSRNQRHYGNERFRYLDSLTRLAGGLLENARLFNELKEHLARIQALERYQESVFSSMTNLLVTTDKDGRIRYFNRAASETFQLENNDIGREFSDRLGKGLGKPTLNRIKKAVSSNQETLGLEGIYKASDNSEIDYSLNLAPITGARGRQEGLTLLFTDQTRERALKAEADFAIEQRRQIKDMFSRYLSQDLVKSLTDNPEMVKLGGAKKDATVFFADITGYTSFSEGKEPEYVIEVINEFFNESVELVINSGGYIDKFIGDCIMAAWGVPMMTEEQDAINAVTTALQIHDLVRSDKRTFFHGDASRLKLSIGMASGPLVAGNVGSRRRMEYTVLGDTVNVAARLEGIATAEEVLITAATRDLIGDRFKLEERKPVMLKGKTKPMVIFNVKGIIR